MARLLLSFLFDFFQAIFFLVGFRFEKIRLKLGHDHSFIFFLDHFPFFFVLFSFSIFFDLSSFSVSFSSIQASFQIVFLSFSFFLLLFPFFLFLILNVGENRASNSRLTYLEFLHSLDLSVLFFPSLSLFYLFFLSFFLLFIHPNTNIFGQLDNIVLDEKYRKCTPMD